MVTEKTPVVKPYISTIETTDDTLSSRAGLCVISRYIRSIGIIDMLVGRFSFLKKSKKGTELGSIFHQLLCYFFDGSSFHLTRFDQLKEDSGYAGSIETPVQQMLSSHAVKRFFSSISIVRVWLFRKVLRLLFLRQLYSEQPDLIKLGIDTMVLNNDEARKREGVEPTYKKVKGFQPLQLFWGRYLIDAIFRNGKAHSNHGNHAYRIVAEAVRFIRKHYSQEVPIVLLADSGFFDEQLIEVCERFSIGFIIGGKMYENVKTIVENQADEAFYEYKKGRQSWFYTEFGNRCKSWNRIYRAVYAKPISDEAGQILLEFDRPETVMYTNLGMNNAVTKRILEVRGKETGNISAEAIISSYHERGRDELVNRGLKDFGTEQLPFLKFSSNAAFYYLMCIAFFLFESYKYDMGGELIPLTWYATTFRRICLDVAGKIVRTGRKIIMKITRAAHEMIKMDLLWQRSISAPPVPVFCSS